MKDINAALIYPSSEPHSTMPRHHALQYGTSPPSYGARNPSSNLANNSIPHTVVCSHARLRWVSVSPRLKKTGNHNKMDRNRSPGSHPGGLTGARFFFRAMPWWWCLVSPAAIMQHLAASHFSSGTKTGTWRGHWKGGRGQLRTFEISPWECICLICALYIIHHVHYSSPEVGE